MEKKKKSKRVVIGAIIIVLILTIAVLVCVLWNVLNRNKDASVRDSSGALVLNKTKEELTQKNNDNSFTTDMNVIWNFEKGDVASKDAYIGNSEANSRDVYFEIYLADDPNEEIIYTSPIMPTGTYLSELKLQKTLKKGSYPAYCKFHLVDEDGKEVSHVIFSVTINILN